MTKRKGRKHYKHERKITMMDILDGYIVRILTAVIASGLGVAVTTLGLSSSSINIAEVAGGVAVFIVGLATHYFNHKTALLDDSKTSAPQKGVQNS
jgi:hypothetical protein